MGFVKSNFLYNSSIPCEYSMELPNAFVVNVFQFHWVVNNIYNLDRSMLVILVSIEDIRIC